MALPTDIFNGGQMTDLPAFTSTTFDGTELFEIVAPGNAASGVNYSVTTAKLISSIVSYLSTPLILTSGATLASPYTVPITPFRFLINKTIPSNSYVNLQSSLLYGAPILIRDLAGNADTYPIQVTFSGIQLCDGLSSVTIATPYGGYWFNPLASGAWYLGTA